MMRGVVVMAVALLCAVPARAQDRPLPGKKLTMMSRGARQMTVFIAKARLDTQFQPEVTGAKLRIVNPTSGESRVVDLPASGWSSNAHGTVFKFKNPSAPGGSSPVKAALVKHKSGITVIAKTTGITLDEQKQCLQCQCVGAGDVGVSLLWSDTNDLDLHVIDPSGEEITWFNRTSVSGGMLDVDANPGCFTPTTMPLENVFWPVGGAPHGTYVVRVNFYALCPGGAAAPARRATPRRSGSPVWPASRGRGRRP